MASTAIASAPAASTSSTSSCGGDVVSSSSSSSSTSLSDSSASSSSSSLSLVNLLESELSEHTLAALNAHLATTIKISAALGSDNNNDINNHSSSSSNSTALSSSSSSSSSFSSSSSLSSCWATFLSTDGERFGLSQFWYSESTARLLAMEALTNGGKWTLDQLKARTQQRGSAPYAIACVSCPATFFALLQICEEQNIAVNTITTQANTTTNGSCSNRNIRMTNNTESDRGTNTNTKSANSSSASSSSNDESRAVEGVWCVCVTLLEFDERFAKCGDCFVRFDFNYPERIPKAHRRVYDFVLLDPPYLNIDCLTKNQLALQMLARTRTHIDNVDSGAQYESECKVLFCTGAVLREAIGRVCGLRPTKFRPQHRVHLMNEFRCYANYDPQALGGWDERDEK